jgi:hypothetical protein
MSALFMYTTMNGTPDLARQADGARAVSRHRAVRGRHHQDRAVHLRRTVIMFFT